MSELLTDAAHSPLLVEVAGHAHTTIRPHTH